LTQIQQINATFKRRKRLNFSRQRRKKVLPLFVLMDNVQFCPLLAKEELPMKHLTVEQRYTISVMLPKKMPFFLI
jgi:hypothetical protein